MNNKVPWHKLGKYISGDCTSQEREEVEAWIDADPSRVTFVNRLEEIWEKSATGTEWDIDEGWNELSKKLEKTKKSPLRLIEPSAAEFQRNKENIRKKRRKLFGIRVAASIGVLAVVLIYFFMHSRQAQPTPEATLDMQEIVVKKGQRSLFQLSDGTRVWLNGGSRMEIPNRFSPDIREVYLKGEAFFDVTPDPDKAFVIHAGKSVTHVLGTQFNLQAYPEEEIQIVVKEGRVAFGSQEAGDKTLELVENQMGILSDGIQPSISQVGNLNLYTGWVDGQLVFKDTPLQQVMEKLERWYDIECKLADSSLKDRTVTGTFEEESMTEVLNIISLSVGMTYKKENRDITFISKATAQ